MTGSPGLSGSIEINVGIDDCSVAQLIDNDCRLGQCIEAVGRTRAAYTEPHVELDITRWIIIIIVVVDAIAIVIAEDVPFAVGRQYDDARIAEVDIESVGIFAQKRSS